MNLNKMFVFIFVFFIVFSALLVTMPSDFKLLGVDADVQDKEVRDYFDEHDVAEYNYTLSVNLSYPESKQYDFGLPEGQQLEFYWGQEGYWVPPMLQLKHLTDNFWGWWWGWHYLEVQEPYATMAGIDKDSLWKGLQKEEMLALWDEDYNASYCEFACDHLAIKLFILTANQSWTLEESWDNGYLKLFTSYNIDWTATGTSMWHIMMQLLAFQNPELGIPGIGGTILTLGFGGGLWACIAILAYALITAVIPLVPGWSGD